MAVVLAKRRKLLIPCPSPEDEALIRGVFPTTIKMPTHDGGILILPLSQDALKVVGNMGIDTSGCELFFHFYRPVQSINGDDAWWWQLRTAAFLAHNQRAFCTSTPRTGKTLSTLMAIDFLQKLGLRAALIVAPLTVANDGAWMSELEDWFPDKKVIMVHSDREAQIREPADVYIINPEGLLIISDTVEELVSQNKIQIGAIDELTDFANANTNRWKHGNKALQGLKYLWGLTGFPGGADKVYGQIKLIQPRRVPGSEYQWRNITQYKAGQYKWVPKANADDIIVEAMQPCIRYDKADIMKVPMPITIPVKAEMSKEQDKAYNQMLTHAMAEIGAGTIDAASASVIATKLLQISSGCVITPQGPVNIDMTPKLEQLELILRSTPRKKVIYANYTGVIDRLVDDVRAMGFTCEKVDGSVTGKKRSARFRSFMQDPDEIHVLVCHAQTTAFGVELAAADSITFFGPITQGAFTYSQAHERLSSSKQEAKETFIYHLSATPADLQQFRQIKTGVGAGQRLVDRLKELVTEADGEKA